MQTENKYVPGVCNIGDEEIKMRRNVGFVFTLITIAVAALLLYTDSTKASRLIIFVPALIAAIGFLQARAKFCVNFAMSGLFNFENMGKSSKIVDMQDRTKDRREAWKIITYAGTAAIIVTAVFYFF